MFRYFANRPIAFYSIALGASTLGATLREDGSYTLLAPTNTAFSKMDQDLLRKILSDQRCLDSMWLLLHVCSFFDPHVTVHEDLIILELTFIATFFRYPTPYKCMYPKLMHGQVNLSEVFIIVYQKPN